MVAIFLNCLIIHLLLHQYFRFFSLKNNDDETEVIYTAIADYTPFETSELSFIQGDILQVLRVGDGGWWFARSQRTFQEGWVPGSYLEEVHQDVNT